jgi:hypothetical protein
MKLVPLADVLGTLPLQYHLDRFCLTDANVENNERGAYWISPSMQRNVSHPVKQDHPCDDNQGIGQNEILDLQPAPDAQSVDSNCRSHQQGSLQCSLLFAAPPRLENAKEDEPCEKDRRTGRRK